MTTNTNPISANYSDDKLSIFIEKYIAQQKSSFTFKGVCSYVLFWAKGEGKTANTSLYESNELYPVDKNKVHSRCHC